MVENLDNDLMTMKRDEAKARVIEDIATVGELTRMITQRYDAMFSGFYSILLETLQNAVDMAEAAHTTMEFSDAAVETLRTSFAGQPKFACAKGCSACCHLFVAVPPGVAKAIAGHINVNFSSIDREKLIQRLEIAASTTAASPVPQTVRIPCPLLDDAGSCSVYAVRPLSCRSFTSTSLPRCEQVVFGVNAEGAGVDQNPARYRLYEFATRALEETARRRGLSSQQHGLSAALLAELC